jgi:hypothetical protein
MCVGSSGDMFFAQETIVDCTVHRVSPISPICLSSNTIQLDSNKLWEKRGNDGLMTFWHLVMSGSLCFPNLWAEARKVIQCFRDSCSAIEAFR